MACNEDWWYDVGISPLELPSRHLPLLISCFRWWGYKCCRRDGLRLYPHPDCPRRLLPQEVVLPVQRGDRPALLRQGNSALQYLRWAVFVFRASNEVRIELQLLIREWLPPILGCPRDLFISPNGSSMAFMTCSSISIHKKIFIFKWFEVNLNPNIFADIFYPGLNAHCVIRVVIIFFTCVLTVCLFCLNLTDLPQSDFIYLVWVC